VRRLPPVSLPRLIGPVAVALPVPVHEITVAGKRLRVERDRRTGQHTYYINGVIRDVNAYLAVTRRALELKR
jgi:hypothetical protein